MTFLKLIGERGCWQLWPGQNNNAQLETCLFLLGFASSKVSQQEMRPCHCQACQKDCLRESPDLSSRLNDTPTCHKASYEERPPSLQPPASASIASVPSGRSTFTHLSAGAERKPLTQMFLDFGQACLSPHDISNSEIWQHFQDKPKSAFQLKSSHHMYQQAGNCSLQVI